MLGVCSVAALILFAQVLLLLRPPTDLDRKCLGKPLLQMNQCIRQYQLGGSP
jgi:hypothetical protein